MKDLVDFKNVVDTVRFDLLGSIELPTPSGFEKLSDEEKARLYQQIWDLHHDMCCYLSSSLYIDEINKKYVETDSQDSNRNDSTDRW